MNRLPVGTPKSSQYV